MEWKTRVTEILGCKYPIIQGAYGGFGRSDIAAPVSAAGGFGIITGRALRTPEKLRKDIQKAKSMTDQPFGINFTMGGDDTLIAELRDAAIEEGVKAIFTSANDARHHGKRIQEAGIVWVHKVATVKHAVSAARQGADAIVIVGIEGAGMKSPIQISTFTAVTMAAKQIDVPIIAAGGIGDARTFLGALGMGAEAVYMGTAFMATVECPISQRYKELLVAGDPYDHKTRARTFGLPYSDEEWKKDKLSTYGGSMAMAYLDRVKTCKELIDEIIAGAEEILAGGGIAQKIIAAQTVRS